MFLENEIGKIEEFINQAEKLNIQVSEKGVDWHIDHSLKVINSVIHALKKSNPSDYKRKFNLLRSFIFTFQFIPKGKGKAPKAVVANGNITKEDLFLQLKDAKVRLVEMEDLPKNRFFKHPYFGMLNLNLSKKFLSIHSKHHIKIIRNIIK
jgi:hypothetical protein